MFDHEKNCEKVRQALGKEGKKNNESATTLWNRYSSQVPVYSRFGPTPRRANFANVLLTINKINISLPYSKPIQASFPQGTIRFDSNFESGNLLLAYKR